MSTPANADPANDVVPVRVTLDLTMVCTRGEYDDGDHYDRIHDALATLVSVFPGSGSSSVMDEADVIKGSVLHQYLEACRAL